MEARNFPHLAEEIKWISKIEKSEGDKSRSKSLINQLKTRISFFYPENTLQIIKNEAHIRLASSMWYVAKYLLLLLYCVLPVFVSYMCIIDISSNVFLFDMDKILSRDNIIVTFHCVSYFAALYLISLGEKRRKNVQRIISEEIKKRNNLKEEKQSFNVDDEEKRISSKANEINLCNLWYDRYPLIACLLLFVSISVMFFFHNNFSTTIISPKVSCIF